MFLKHKLYLYANKFSRLPKFSVKPILSARNTVLYLIRPTATVGSPEVTSPNVKNLREFGRPYFMQYLLDNPSKYSVVNIEQINLEDETNFQSLKLLKAFLDDSQETEISDHLMDLLNEEFEICGVEEICKFVTLFANCENPMKMQKALKLFDEILFRRNLSDEDTLKILWVMKESRSKSVKRTDFRFFLKAVMKLCHKINRLNPNQVAQLFIYLPKLHPEFLRKVKFSIQVKLIETVPELNAEELAIVADGFVRAGLMFTHPELPCIVLNKAVKEIENMHDLLLSKICRLLESNLKHYYIKNLMEFQEVVIPHVSKFKEGTLVRLMLTGVLSRYIYPSLRETVAEILKKNMENLRLHEIERLLFATTVYNIQDEELLNLTLKHFKEKANLKYHGILISFLYHLTHHQLYPEDLLGLILSDSFTSEFDLDLLTFDLKYKYSFINCCVEIEKPNSNLHLLNQEQRQGLFAAFKLRGFLNETLNKRRSCLKRIMYVLEDLYGKNTVCEANCLPHYEAGLVMKFDRNLNPQTFETTSERHFYAKEAVNYDDVFSLFIMLLPRSDFCNENTLILPAKTRNRQLMALGYKPVMLKQIDWILQTKEKNEFNFMKELIEKTLEDLLQENQK